MEKIDKDALNALYNRYKEIEDKAIDAVVTEDGKLLDSLMEERFKIATEFLEKDCNPESLINTEGTSDENVDYELASKILYIRALEYEYTDAQFSSAICSPLWRMIVTGTQEGPQSYKYPIDILWALTSNKDFPDFDIMLGNVHEAGLCGLKISIDDAFEFYAKAEFEKDGKDFYNDARLEYWGIDCNRNPHCAFNIMAGRDQPLSADVLNLYGIMFLDGVSTRRFDEMALEAFRLGASFMYYRSLCNYGLLTFCGIGCKPDKELGKKLLEMAVFAGSEKAKEYLNIINSGKDIIFDIVGLDVVPGYFGKYLEEVKLQAESGNTDAMVRLAEIYYDPEVFRYSCAEEAYRWYLKASVNGSLYAALWAKDLCTYVDGGNCDEIDSMLSSTSFSDSWIKDKISSTSMMEPYGDYDLLEESDEERLKREQRFCPIEALYWQLIERNESSDSRDWDGWLRHRDKELSRFNKKVNILQEDIDEF